MLSTQGRSRQKNLECIVPDLNRWCPHTSRKGGGIEDPGAGSCFNPTSQQISYNSNRYRSDLHLLILICVCMGSCKNKIFWKNFKTKFRCVLILFPSHTRTTNQAWRAQQSRHTKAGRALQSYSVMTENTIYFT